MRFDIITIFPQAFESYFTTSILKRAQEKKRVKIAVHNLRDYTTDKHKTVDDKPYGGGAGMVLKVEPLYRCISHIANRKSLTSPQPSPTRRGRSPKSKVILLAAGGKQLDQRMAEKFAKLDQIVFICGHYEGVDERVMEFVDEAVSVGPYVLTGGELPTMTIVDAVTRLIPGVLGNPKSLKEESFGLSRKSLTSPQPSPARRGRKSGDKKKITTNYKLQTTNSKEYPHYTRPEIFSPKKGVHWAVPKILLSGDHAKIAQWRRKQQGK